MLFGAILIIATIAPFLSTANSFTPELGKLKVILEKTNLLDTRGDWQRKAPDYHRKNYAALKKDHNFYIELGLGYDLSVGYEQTFHKIESQLVISYNQKFKRNFKPSRYTYDEMGRIQLNDEIERFYYENRAYYRVLPISYSWFDKQIFIKKKLLDSENSTLTYQLGYIFHSKGSYFENGVKKSSSHIVFNDPKMGKQRIGKHQINHELFIRRYLKLSAKGSKEYYDLNFKLVTDQDHKLIQAKFETGIGFKLTKKSLLELKCGFETKSFSIDRDVLIARITIYNKINRHIWIKNEFLRKYAAGTNHFDAIKITAITSGLEVRI